MPNQVTLQNPSLCPNQAAFTHAHYSTDFPTLQPRIIYRFSVNFLRFLGFFETHEPLKNDGIIDPK